MLKTKILVLLICILALPLVIANENSEGNWVVLNDLYDDPIQAVQLRAKQGVLIEYEGTKSTFIIDEIGYGEFVRLKAFIDYQNNSKGLSWPLRIGQTFLVDLNKDEIDDLIIRIHDIPINEFGEETVILLFEYIGNPKIEIGGKSSEITQPEKEDISIYAITGLLLFGLVSFLGIKYYRKKK